MIYPLVSCLMPTWNRRKYVPRAIRMFQRQKWLRKELIIIDDGDDCIEDLVPWWDFRIRYVRLTQRMTLGEKLNMAARMAHGSVCINFDDDDFMSPDRIKIQVGHMRVSGKPVVGFSSLIYYLEGDPHGYEYTGDAWYASGSSHCYTRDWILAHPRPDMTVGEDNVFAAEARKHGAISNMSGQTCLVACDHADNCSARMGGDPEFLRFVRDTADQFRKIPLEEFAATIAAGV